MAFRVVQAFNFENVQYHYDRRSDVLYISFGPPVPAVAIQVEDWLALRVSVTPPTLAGITVVGFRRIFDKVNRYVEVELADRVERLARAAITLQYDDTTDTLVMRIDEPSDLPSLFEPVAPYVYLEKSIPSKTVLGFKIVEFTRHGPQAVEALFGAIVDTLLEPERVRDENARLITNSLMRAFDWRQLAAVAA